MAGVGSYGCAFGPFGPAPSRPGLAKISSMVISEPGIPEAALELAPPPRLSPDRCRSLLAEATDGYLALSRGALPVVLPVTCALDGESLLVRAGPGSLDPLCSQPGVVAFGTTIPSSQGPSVHGMCRWEILVQGRAERVCHPAPNVPPRFPLINGSLTTVFRVTMELLTGWEYRPAF
jgi:Pyridoxamine 5'-phosphate oxidase